MTRGRIRSYTEWASTYPQSMEQLEQSIAWYQVFGRDLSCEVVEAYCPMTESELGQAMFLEVQIEYVFRLTTEDL